MKKINKKGFSMVELLAVITILGILSTISIVSVQRILERAKDEYYDKQRKNLVMAAQSYLNNYKPAQPKVLGQKVVIDLKTLQEQKYIDKVVDYNKGTCYGDKTHVNVYNHSLEDSYSYTAYLVCENHDDTDYEETISPNITIVAPKENQIDNTKVRVTIIPAETEEKATENNLTLSSYSYKIFKKVKGENSKEEYKEVKVQKTKSANDAKSKSFNIDFKEFVPGELKIEVTATNSIGNTTIESTTGKYADNVPPQCVFENDKDNGKLTQTIAFTRDATKTMTVKCVDTGSGCVHDTYTKTFKADIRKGNIPIYDKEGNKTNCQVNVFIDQNDPKLKVTPSDPEIKHTITEEKYETDWTNKTVCFKYTATDDGGIKSIKWEANDDGLSLCNKSKGIDTLKTVKEYTKTFGESDEEFKTKRSGEICIPKEGYRKGKLTAIDYSGNKTSIDVIAKIDKTAPTTPTTVSMFKWKDNNTKPSNSNGLQTYANNTWSTKKVLTTASGATDKISCIKEYQYTQTGSNGNEKEKSGQSKNIEKEGTTKIKYRACDYAGNCSSYTPEKTVKLDWSAPTAPTVTLKKWKDNNTKPTNANGLQNYGDNTWSNKKVYTMASGSIDKTSGGVYYEVTTTGKTTNVTNHKASTRNIEAQGISYIKYRACDSAGNCTAYSKTYTVKVDTVAPNCGSNNGSSTWTSGNRTLTVNCSDATSGCTKNSFSNTFSNTTKTANITIQDNAGNTKACGVNVYVDKTAPSCGSNNGSTSWSTGNRTVKVNCNDNESGCESTSFSKTYTQSTKTANITIKDKVGNTRQCPINVYIDKTPPSCGSNNGSTSWTNNDRTIKLNCNDNESGCVQSSYSKTFTANTKTASFTIKDKVGHTTTCPVNVYVDKTAPSCGNVSGSSTSWTTSNRTVTVACNDSLSGCQQGTFSKTYTQTTNTANITIRDNAGNTKNCGVNVYIDKTPPSKPTSGYIGGVSGSNANASIQGAGGGSSDSNSGIRKYLYCIRQNNSAMPDRYDGCFTDNRAYTRHCGTTTYAYTVAVDNAGNRSEVKYLGATSDNADSWGGWSGCSASCGGGSQTRWNSCALINWSQSQSCNTHRCPPSVPANVCSIRGNVKRTGVARWKCTCGKFHTAGYNHYCSDANGTLVHRSSNRHLSGLKDFGYTNNSINRYSWVCPERPYGPGQGWTVISD